MSKRIRLGLVVIVAELGAAAVCLQVSAVAQSRDTSGGELIAEAEEFVLVDAEPVTPGGETAVKDVSNRRADENQATAVPGTPDEFRLAREAEVKTDKEVPKSKAKQVGNGPRLNLLGRDEARLGFGSSNADLQDTYVELHKRIAERLTPEELTERCKALEKELNELVAEDEIEQIEKQLSELKRKNSSHKGISTRLQRAIDALKNTPVGKPSADDFKAL